MTISFERAQLLLDVAGKCGASPAYSAIAGEINVELTAMAKECSDQAAARADKIRPEEQVAAQKALADADADTKAQATTDAKANPPDSTTLADRKI